MAKLSTSGEWLVAGNDVPTSGPVEFKQNSKLKSASFFDAHICYECGHTFRTCDCKACLKCGTPFLKYFGTTLIKGRSHCRVCASPVCVTCIVVMRELNKVCTRCHLKQKEEEISTEKALSAICEAKFGLGENYGNFTKLRSMSQQTDALFEAAKKGLDHVIIALFINFGCKVDSTDSKQNTPLFYAAEGGYLQCVVMLLEKGADINAKNNVGWTPLHTVAWKGVTDNHTECVKYFIEMNASVVEESNTNETAGDVAERCGANIEIVQILRAAEVEVSINEMNRKILIIMGSLPTPKERRFCRLILSLLNYIEKNNTGCQKEDQEKEDRKENEVSSEPETIPRSYSLDSRMTSRPTLCNKCRGPTKMSVPPSPLAQKHSFEVTQRSQADVGHVDRTPSPKPVHPPESITNISVKNLELLAQQKKLEREKSDWEDRCRKLMASIGVSSKDHKKEIDDLEEKIKLVREEHAEAIIKCEATYTNKLSKMRQETELQLHEKKERMKDLEEAQRDVLRLQKNYKMTWVPDDLVKECQINNCRAPFSKTNRKHHCRCCGRVFCWKCSQQKKRLDILGYTNPVRVCSTCYDLADDIFKSKEEPS